MRRAYTSVVVLFILPMLTFFWLLDYASRTPRSPGNSALDRFLQPLMLLSAWSRLWGAPNHSFWTDWGWLIFLLIIGFIALSLGDRIVEREGRSFITSIGRLLDEGKASVTEEVGSVRWERLFLHASASGHLHGRPVTAELRYSYGRKFNYNSLVIELACRSPWMFEVRKRSAASRLMAPFEQQVQTGDPVLDERLSFVGFDTAFIRWICHPEIRQKIVALILEREVTSMKGDPDAAVLRFSSERFHLFWKGLLLENMARILADAKALADSLERSQTSIDEPGSPGSPESIAESAPQRLASDVREPHGSRHGGAVLIATGIVLLSGIPGTLALFIAPQNQLMAWFAAFIPLLGFGALLKGIITYRRSRRPDRKLSEKDPTH